MLRLRLRSLWVPAALSLVLLCTLFISSCTPEKRESRFGMDITELKPLIVTVEDRSSGEISFSRDPSNISAAIQLFEKMDIEEAGGKTDGKGLVFTLSTMHGDFSLGEFIGERIRVGGREYTTRKDYGNDIRLLHERIRSEAGSVCDVPEEKILSVHPENTYKEILELFGQTLETSTSGNEIAYLYKYNNRPFYLTFRNELDTVGITGEQLMESILLTYNLGGTLTSPQPLPGGRVDVYKYAFKALVSEYIGASAGKVHKLFICGDSLVYIDEGEKALLEDYLSAQCGIPAESNGYNARLHTGSSGELIVWVSSYSYIGQGRMDFTVSARMGGVTHEKTFSFSLKDNKWECIFTVG